MKEYKRNPLVSVPVTAYNSSKTIIDTLESIKAQTYPNIELIVSDDCSSDDTVAVCRKWIEQNRRRFVRAEILTTENNTGTAGNLNRAEYACRGEWVKIIAGDDLLTPTCVADYIQYATEHPETIYLFGRCKAFGADQKRCAEVDKVFDYSFFAMTPDEQLHQLIFEGNCVPATTVFYNRLNAQNIGINNDERIPLLEDWPRWINLIRAGVKLHFVDKVLVRYRVGGASTNNRPSLNYYRSLRLFCFLYQYPIWYEENKDKAVERAVNEEMDVYQWLIDAEKQLTQIQQSKAYRLGKLLLKPFKWLKK